VAEFFGVGESRVKFEIDGPFADVDDEFAVSAIVVLPAAMLLL
jgi:hypothetical protein